MRPSLRLRRPEIELRGRRARRRRAGAVLVWCAFLLIVLIGMVGLVIDGGIMFASHRQCQNAADAAAMAAAMDLLQGNTASTATASAVTYVTDAGHNNLPDAAVVVNIPPASGPYAGVDGYVEAIVTRPTSTFFIHALPSFTGGHTVSGRAVAGYELVASGDGVMVLDPTAWPGLDVSGGGVLRVDGNVIVNSEGGGVDENGDPSEMELLGHKQWAARAGQPNSSPEDGIHASYLQVVGGVDVPDLFHNIDPLNPDCPLYCNKLPAPDPFATLPTPTVANGVDATYWGNFLVTGEGLEQGGDPSWQSVDPVSGEFTVTMQPGIYDAIRINASTVIMNPGIYVVAATENNAITITGGEITGLGVMFYMTGDNYDPGTGMPDASDPPDPLNLSPPPKNPATNFGSVTINANAYLTPIATDTYPYPGVNAAINTFDGMLFYQRRMNPESVSIEGNADEGRLEGTIYAKWTHFKISGQGDYDAQFVVGSVAVPGQGNVTIEYTGQSLGRAPQVFLVE